MDLPLFAAVVISAFIICLVYVARKSDKKDKGVYILSLFVVPILTGVVVEIISNAIIEEPITNVPEPSTSISTTEPTANTALTEPAFFVGDTIQFGSYPQGSSKKEPIDWLVLDVEDDKVLVISCEALDSQKYHSQHTNVTWATCSLRQWLNDAFYNTAFTAEEQLKIQTTTVSADPNALYRTDPGADTKDKIFLLSITEATEYFGSNSERVCRATQYAIDQNAYVNTSTGGSWWWLRTPGNSNKDAASVNSDGSIDYDDGYVTSNRGVVRPAMWISLN